MDDLNQPRQSADSTQRLDAPWRCLGWLLVALLSLFASPGALGQDLPDLDGEPFRTWDRTAQTAEQLLNERNPSNTLLENLRRRLVQQRAETYDLANSNRIDIRSLEAQLNSLGPAPQAGMAEAEEMANKRRTLEAALSQARAPILAADAAHERADVLVAELGALIRTNITSKLLVKNPAPIFPNRWEEAKTEVAAYFDGLRSEFRELVDSASHHHNFYTALPGIFVTSVVGLVLFLVVQPLVANRLESRSRKVGNAKVSCLYRWLSTLSHVVFPLLSAIALILASSFFNLPLASAETLLETAPAIVIVLLLTYWVGFFAFRPDEPRLRILRLSDAQAKKTVALSVLVGVFLAAEAVLASVEADYPFSPSTVAVMSLPVIIYGCVVLWCMSMVLKTGIGVDDAGQPVNIGVISDGILRLLVYVLRVASVLGAIFVAVGYDNLARQALHPMVETWGIVLLLAVTYGVALRCIGRLLFEKDKQEHDLGLIPFTVALVLIVLASPLVALVWGATLGDLSEVWRLLSEGVSLGDIQLSLDTLIVFSGVFVAGFVITKWLQKLLRENVLPKTRTDSGARAALVTGVGYLGICIATLVAISAAGLNLSSLAVVAGALSVGIGFGLQTTVANFVSGIILLVERPVKEGDWVEVSGHSGYVRKISVRATRIETFDMHDVIIPNSDLVSGVVKNMTLSNRRGRLIAPVAVAHDADLDAVQALMLDCARQSAWVLEHPAPTAIFLGMQDGLLTFELRCYIHNVEDIVDARSDMMKAIHRRLAESQVEIPAPRRGVVLSWNPGTESPPLESALSGK